MKFGTVNRRSTITSLVAAACLLSACGGPKAPFDVGTQAAPLDLVLGEHEAVVEAPVGPLSIALPPLFAPFLPLDTPKPGPVEDLGPCPDFDPLAPVQANEIEIVGPPQPGSYPYRATTTDQLGDKKSTFAGDTNWEVKPVRKDPTTGGDLFTIEVTVGTTKSQRTFLLLPKTITKLPTTPVANPNDPNSTDLNFQVIDAYNGTAPLVGLPRLPRNLPNLGRFGNAGIYLVSQTMGERTFTPTLPIPLLQTPVRSTQFTAVGTDGVVAMIFKSTVKKTELVNACGKKLETIHVRLTDGKIAGLTDDGKIYDVDFTESIYFGLQFGGLPLKDEGTVSSGSTLPGGLLAEDKIERKFDFTINTAPKPAKTA